jgi:mono/diheme cytochrome c family protein
MTPWWKRNKGLAALALLVALFAIAQFIQPPIPVPPAGYPKAAWEHSSVGPQVAAILKRSCADCHSNETRWPWYSRISPGSWLMANHVVRGRRQLNFSRQSEISEETRGEIHDTIRDGTMPPSSYLVLHGDARLSPADKKLLMEWALGN